MAVSKVADRASVAGNSAVTTVDLVMTGLTVGNILIIRTAADNSGGGGAARTISVSDQSGSILNGAGWTAEQRNQDPGAASAGTTANLLIVLIQATSGTLRLTYSGSVVQAAVAEEWTGLAGISTVGTTGNNVGTASTNLASVTKSATSGNLVYAIEAVEGPNGDTYTNDADTTNGSWTPLTKLGTTNGTADTNQTTYGGYKVVSGSGSQTYNPTINNARDSAGIIVELQAVVTHSGTVATAWSGWTATAVGATMRTGTIATAWGGWTATAAGTVPNVRMDIANLRNRDWGYAEYVGIVGGYGQSLVEVTNSNDSGAGSLREALETGSGADEGLRHIVLTTDVSVMLNTPIVCTGSFVTLDATGHSLIIQSGFEDENTITFTGDNITVEGVEFRTSSAVGIDSLRFRGGGPYMVSGCTFFSPFEAGNAGDALAITHRGANDVYVTVVGCEFRNLKRTVVIHSTNNDSTEDEGAYFVTMAWNHIHHVREAFPLAREAHVHLYNNLIERWGEFDGTATPGARMSNDGVTLQTGFTNWMLAENNVVLPLTTGEADYAGDTTTTPLTEWFGPGTNDGSPNMRADGTYLKVNGSTTPTETEVNPGDVGTPPYAYRLMTADDTLQTFIAAHTGVSGNGGVVPPDYDASVSSALGGGEANSGQTIGFVRNGEVVTVLTEGSGTVDTMTLWVGGDSFAMTESPTDTWTATLSGLTDGVEDMWAVGTGSGFVGETRTPIWPVLVYTPPTISGTVASNWGERAETIRPDATTSASVSNLIFSSGTSGTLHTLIDEDPATPDEGDYVVNPGSGAAFFVVSLGDVSALGWASSVRVRARTARSSYTSGSSRIDATLERSDGTDVTSLVTLNQNANGFFDDDVDMPLNAAGLADALSPSGINGWRLRIDFSNNGAESAVFAVAVDVTQSGGWLATAAGTVTAGAPTHDGTIADAWSGWTATAAGTVIHPATIATAWSGWTATADGVVTHPATVTTAWTGWTATAQGHRVWDATIATAFSGWTATASATVTHPATITTALDGWTATATATRETAATATTAWAGWTATATATITHDATITTAFAGWTATATATVTIHATIRTLWAEWEVDSDDFNRADAAAPGLGAGWDAPGFALDDNMALKNSGGDYGRRLADIGTLDHWVEVEVVGTPGVPNDDHNMVVARADATLGQNAVLGYVNPDSGKQGLIARFQSGSFVVMGGGTTGLDISGTYTLRLWIVDGEARLYHNGALVHTQDVSTLTSLGTFGGLNANTGSPPFDNYRAGTAGWRATAVGHRVWAGTITTAWDGWTATATGTVQTSVNGTIDTAWSGWTATATATRETFGTITTAWAGWTATADGLRTTAGAITTIWSGWTATADATVIHPATIATAFDGWTATAAGHRVFDAAITTAWAGWTATAVGEVSTPGGTIDGTITTAWSGWTATAAGVVTHLATITTAWDGWTATALGHRVWDATITTAWSGWTATATATRTVNATIATALAGWTATASATRTTFGAITTAWAGWTATATGLRTTAGAITTVWAGWTATAIAETAGQVNASIATEWAGWTATASATVTVVATIDTTWGAWSGIAVATRQVNGTVETLWGGWDAQGTAILTRLGTISTGWAGWTATADGLRTTAGAITTIWSGWTATAVASVFGTLVIIGILTAVRVDPIRTATSVAPGHSAVRVNPVLTAESATPQRIATRYDPNRVASRP